MFEQSWPDGDYRMFQVGVVVDDLLAACADFARVFGMGPFHVFPRIETDCWYRGIDTAVDLQIAVAQAGPVQFELIQQHCDRPSVYRELAGTRHPHPPALHDHLRLPGQEGVVRGARATRWCRRCTCAGSTSAFVDTLADFGFYTELAEDVPGFVEGLTRVARTCAEWDGTDPCASSPRTATARPDRVSR